MICPDCGTPDSKIVRTITGPRFDIRQRRCHCGTSWNTTEKPVKGTQVKLVGEIARTAPVKTNVKLPTAQPRNAESLISDQGIPSLLPSSDQGSISSLLSNQTPARVGKRGRPTTVEYSPDFLEFWDAISPRLGNKQPAFKAWVKFKGEIRDVNFIIERYLLRASTTKWKTGYAQHVATWLNERGWDTEPDPSEFDNGVPEKVRQSRDSARNWAHRSAG